LLRDRLASRRGYLRRSAPETAYLLRKLSGSNDSYAPAVPIVLRAMSRKWLSWKFWRDRAFVAS